MDFIARRSRLAFLDTDAAGRALPRVIQILAAEHKWDKARQKQELQKAKEFLETFKSSKNAQFRDGKHIGKHYLLDKNMWSRSKIWNLDHMETIAQPLKILILPSNILIILV